MPNSQTHRRPTGRGIGLSEILDHHQVAAELVRLRPQNKPLYDPLQINPRSPNSSFRPAIDSAELTKALRSITPERYKQRLHLLSTH